MSGLETEFQEVVNQINAELHAASKYLEKAIDLAQSSNIEGLGGSYAQASLGEDAGEELGEGISPQEAAFINGIKWDALLTEIDAAGWASSAFFCTWF